ncbi:leucine-rich repeat domain-containing protein [Butyrivibrio sp. VCD2006]|uniref:leucine-rich repeat domain-containing protein n=1 Tax=Butyrivibrio sp. VCD2006 TaxID=1280664 RepID=UPI000478FF63|nr:leucine-rich repeat domain-containing protein [Butyrivibrio sp. VCD2006]
MSIYEGNESYIFISYSHKDNKKVMPVIKRLQKDGYRVWYDDGIEVGSEWPETVANHLLSCELFLVFVSNSYLDSFNCKREIDFSVSKRKSTIAVILEETNMSPGTEMQLSSVQFLNKYLLKDEEFYSKLYQSELIKPCQIEAEENLPDEKTESRNTTDSTNRQKKRLNFSSKALGSFKTVKTKKLNIKKFAAIACSILLVGILCYILGLNLTHITIAGVRYSTDEEHLTIKDTTLTTSDTRKLARFKKLQLLSFENCDFSDNSENELSRLKYGIKSFHVIDCKGIDNYNWLSRISSVEWLEIKNSGFKDSNVNDVWFFTLDKLISLDLSNNKEFTNLSGIMKEINSDLQKILLSNTGVHNLAPLYKFENLRMIDISGCEVDSLDPLRNLKNVTYIAADDNNLENLNGLEQMTNLKTLSASGNNLESIEAVKDCIYLERVDFSDNKITDISPLAKSSISLQDLFLNNNGIKDMTPLTGMCSLEVLLIDGNDIDNIDFLDKCDELKILSARKNKITSIDPILNKKNLDALYLSDNMITGDVIFGEKMGIWNDSISDNNVGIWEIQLQHNMIESLEFKGKVPNSLSVYDNPLGSLMGASKVDEAEEEDSEPEIAYFTNSEGHTTIIEDFVEPHERKGTMSGLYKVYLSWDTDKSDKMLDILYSLDEYSNVYLSGCPLDYKSQAEEIITVISYVTNEKMDEIMESDRTKMLDNQHF